MTARRPAPVEERHRRIVAVTFLAEFLEPDSPVMDWVRGNEAPTPPFLPELAQAFADLERDAERAGRVAGLREAAAMQDNGCGCSECIRKRIRELEDGDGA